jgi:hypothetical protein
MLEQFLDNIVAKYIGHQLQGIWLYFTKQLLLFVAVGSLELLLDESRSMLVTTEFDNVIVDILERC